METEIKTPIKQAIDIAGGMTALARALNVKSHTTVYQWAQTRVPAEYCPLIEALTGVRCEALRPDIAWHVLRNPTATPDATQPV